MVSTFLLYKVHFSPLTFGFNGGSCGQPSSLEGGELRVTTKMPAGNNCNTKLQSKASSINKILVLQKYRLFLHYFFIQNEERNTSRSTLRGMNELCC